MDHIINYSNIRDKVIVILVMALLVPTIIMAGGISKKALEELVILENKKIQIGILPEVGGRVVLFRNKGKKNIFKAHPQQWENPSQKKPELSAFSDFKAFNGHIVWLGPQSQWWTKQNINQERKENKAVWPPDPYLIYGNYKISQKNSQYVKMVGEKSPISGIKMTKEISIVDSNRVLFKAQATNITDSTLKWDLWMNTRLDGFAKCYVPVTENSEIEFIKEETKNRGITDYKNINGYFTLLPSQPEKKNVCIRQEVHIEPQDNFMVGIDSEQVLFIKFNKLKDKFIHEDHSQVELYSYISDNQEENLLELELHGQYTKLRPGETMELTETWYLFELQNCLKQEKQLELINKLKEEL